MQKKLTVAVIGCGGFAASFVPLFQKHPYVEKVYVCDIVRERAESYQEKFGAEIVESFEAALENKEINAVAIFTERHTHGPLVVQALRAGKHVYSAVPMASEITHCKEIVEAVEETGLTYMMGETCIYYPSSMYCKEQYEAGEFGNFVYGEAQYHHDITHFPEVFKNDKSSAGVPPFYYPTHSTAMILHALNTHVTKVAAFGYVDQENDGFFGKGKNMWDNPYSNSYSLMMLANGGTARINECRRIAFKAPSSHVSAFYGTKGSYQFQGAQHAKYTLTKTGVTHEDVSDYVNPEAFAEMKKEPDFKNQVANHVGQWNSFAPIQAKERARLPKEYDGLPNGHMASHQFLIDDFCKAAYHGTLPTVHAWLAARFTVPGLVAHEAVKAGGAVLDVPDFGEPPEKFRK